MPAFEHFYPQIAFSIESAKLIIILTDVFTALINSVRVSNEF